MRPPGHHAGVEGPALGARSLGFCYFNNLAIAVEKSNKKTLIVDFDGHHGNGTQEIFQGNRRVHYISLHRKDIYPKTGNRSIDNIFNIPLDRSANEAKFLTKLRKALSKKTKNHYFDQLAVSAGFDTHKQDLSSLNISLKGYKEIGKILAEFELPVFSVLEGGYMLGERPLGKRIDSYLTGLKTEK